MFSIATIGSCEVKVTERVHPKSQSQYTDRAN